MLTQIKLKNFKIFKEETTFPLAKINLLTGINGRGKSSLLQSLLLMRQSIEQDENTSQIYLNGSCVRLGSFEDVRNERTDFNEGFDIAIYFKADNIKFTDWIGSIKLQLKLNDSQDSIINMNEIIEENEYIYEENNGELIHDYYKDTYIRNSDGFFYDVDNEKRQGILRNLIFNDFDNELVDNIQFPDVVIRNFNLNKIHYISADRIGPKAFYLKENLSKFINVGAKGEFTANVLSLKKNELVNDKLYLGEDAKTLVQQTEEWLKEIFGKAKFRIDDTNREVIYLLFNTQSTTPKFKPSNVGFGYSYVLPIIVSGLIAQAGEILIVENPEAHLHPRAQSKLTHFLAKVAACGVQVFIESHSEHILNALQIAVKKEEFEITNEDVSVLYFHEKENGYFTQIPIKPNGKIEVWPDGFFDQTEKDLDTILGM